MKKLLQYFVVTQVVMLILKLMKKVIIIDYEFVRDSCFKNLDLKKMSFFDD